MKLILTLTNNYDSVDFQINGEVLIKEALDIIAQNTDFKINNNIKYIYSKRNQEKVSINYSFKQVGIYSGDELIMEDTI